MEANARELAFGKNVIWRGREWSSFQSGKEDHEVATWTAVNLETYMGSLPGRDIESAIHIEKKLQTGAYVKLLKKNSDIYVKIYVLNHVPCFRFAVAFERWSCTVEPINARALTLLSRFRKRP